MIDNTKIKKIFLHFGFPLIIIFTWELLVRISILPHQSIAAPSTAILELFNQITTLDFWRNIGRSLYRLIFGFSLGSFTGIVLGGLAGYSKKASTFIEPTFLTLIPVPPIAWIPFFIALFGTGDLTKIFIVSLGGFSTLFIAAAAGVRATDIKLLEVAKVFNKSKEEIIKQIIFPSTLKYIFANLRIAMALSWTLLLASEMVNASSGGIGWMINDARRFSRAGEMVVGIATVGILGKITDFLLVKLNIYYTKWDINIEDG